MYAPVSGSFALSRIVVRTLRTPTTSTSLTQARCLRRLSIQHSTHINQTIRHQGFSSKSHLYRLAYCRPSPSSTTLQPNKRPNYRIIISKVSKMSTSNPPSPTLSRSPTPTLQSGPRIPTYVEGEDSETETASTANTECTEQPSDDEDYEDPPDYLIDYPFFVTFADRIKAITDDSILPGAYEPQTPEGLRLYYTSKWKEVANDPIYDVGLTNPAAPDLTIALVDHCRYAEGIGGNVYPPQPQCPCCVPDDVPKIKIIAEDVHGGVIKYRDFIWAIIRELYDNSSDAVDGVREAKALEKEKLESIVLGVQPGEAGVVAWNWMSQTRNHDIMGNEIFLYFAKMLEGKKFYESAEAQEERSQYQARFGDGQVEVDDGDSDEDSDEGGGGDDDGRKGDTVQKEAGEKKIEK